MLVARAGYWGGSECHAHERRSCGQPDSKRADRPGDWGGLWLVWGTVQVVIGAETGALLAFGP